jgi:mono/diheme cytochrome c family protein
MVSVFMALVFWAGAYLAFYSGGFQSTVFDPAQVAWAGGGAGVEKAAPDPMVVGKRLYTVNCVACHQANGQGVAGQFPPLAGSEWVVGGDWHGDNHLVKILLQGLQGPIQVEGVTYNGAMPPWKQLKDEQIASILTYIRNEWGNQASPITAEQVAKIRGETAAQTEPWTQAQLKAIPAIRFEAAAPAEPPPAAPAEPGVEPAAPPAPAPTGV